MAKFIIGGGLIAAVAFGLTRLVITAASTAAAKARTGGAA